MVSKGICLRPWRYHDRAMAFGLYMSRSLWPWCLYAYKDIQVVKDLVRFDINLPVNVEEPQCMPVVVRCMFVDILDAVGVRVKDQLIDDFA